MTNEELKSKIATFLATHDNTEKEEWWTTDRGLAEVAMARFLTYLEGKPYSSHELTEKLTGETK